MNVKFNYKKLGRFTYHIINNKNDITPFISKWLKKEWDIDIKEFPEQQWTINWLNLLPFMKFKLDIVEMDKIKLHEDLMQYESESYNFLKSLQTRAEEMEIAIIQGSSIAPLIINKENMELMDGYTRYMILKTYNQKRTYVYLGY